MIDFDNCGSEEDQFEIPLSDWESTIVCAFIALALYLLILGVLSRYV